MPETKRAAIMVNIEPTIHRIILDIISREGVSASAYLRRLVIKDLKARGVLPDSLLASMYEGR